MPTPTNILAMLERTDKWYLGGGKAAIYAPAFPRFLDTPGFWDETYFADIRLERLYALLIIDNQGRPLTLRRALRRWTPDRLVTLYTVEGHATLRIQEERLVSPNDTFATRITVTNSSPQPIRLHLMLWSLQAKQPIYPDRFCTTVAAVEQDLDGFTFAHRLHYGGYGDTPAEVDGWGERPISHTDTEDPAVYVALGGSRLAESWTINFAETTDNSPIWHTSIFPEAFHNGTLPRQRQDLNAENEPHRAGQLHLALHWILEALPNSSDTVTVGASVALSRERAVGQLREDMMTDVVAQSRRSWEAYFASLPNFECDDIYLERYYWYRWYGLRLQTVDLTQNEPFAPSDPFPAPVGFANTGHQDRQDRQEEKKEREEKRAEKEETEEQKEEEQKEEEQKEEENSGEIEAVTDNKGDASGNLRHPCVFEGIGTFRSHVSYSAQCHIRETAWMPDKRLAVGSLLNFLEAQTRDDSHRDGFIPGHLYLWRQDRGFYHSNWGAAALHLFYLTGDLDFVEQVYVPLSRYAEYFERERDRKGTHLYDVLDQGETGQEYTSRYLFAHPEADSWKPIQIKGVDATCYLFELQRTLAIFASALGRHRDARWWDDKADGTRDAVRRILWDTEAALFKDVDPQTLERSPYLAAVGFYPFMSEIATRINLVAWQHLADPQTFGTSYPVPSCSVDDPYFDAQGYWRGRRTNCPWNGRVWPMTNSHLVDGLAHSARTLDARLKPMAVDLLSRFVRMLFHEGDPKRPNSYEHYNPETGTPSLYRGIDDYQHSWIVDLILRHVVGVQPTPGHKGTLIIDPLPFPIHRFRCDNIMVRGHRVDVSWSQGIGFTVRIDGQEVAHLPERDRIEITLI